jgi:hypothetical protein
MVVVKCDGCGAGLPADAYIVPTAEKEISTATETMGRVRLLIPIAYATSSIRFTLIDLCLPCLKGYAVKELSKLKKA